MNSMTVQHIIQNGLKSLTDDLHITIKDYGDLILLDYSQIDSPKFHPVVRECRGLILEKETLKIVCRSFDRFFNYGEDPSMGELDWSQCEAVEKADGSLIRIYNYKGQWFCATRGTAFADAPNAWGHTFKELVFEAMNINSDEEFQALCDKTLSKNHTYIFELTTPENRVVKPYHERAMVLLGARHTEFGIYALREIVEYGLEYCKFPFRKIESYRFKSLEECAVYAKGLKNLDEGYVIYQKGVPVLKIKSDLYVHCHHIKGEGLTPKRVINLILIGEDEEYLTYFGEDKPYFDKYREGLDKLKHDMLGTWEDTREIPDQKEFALAVKDLPYAAVLFNARKHQDNPWWCFNELAPQYKIELVRKYSEE